jgi:long-chain acyl-CoA synthetase
MEQVIESLELGRDDVIFCAIPLFHNFGLVQCMLVAVGTAARLVILKSSGPFQLYRNEALKLLDKERVTIFAGVPFMFDSFIESSTSVDLSSIRICYSAAATLSEKTSKTFRDKFGIPLRDHYGCTELGAMTIELDSNPEQLRQSVGRALKGVHIKIIGSDGQELPPGDAGEIVVRCRAMTRGYLGMGEVDNTAFSDGHFCTGDLGRLDEDGRLYLLGRKKNIIDVVGQKVSPVEVEDVLLKHPAVRDSIVIGVPNPNGNAQIVAAYVVCDGDCTVEDLFSFCHERLANFKVPQIIEFISSVPKNNLGKAPRDRATIESYRVQPGDLEARRNSR